MTNYFIKDFIGCFDGFVKPEECQKVIDFFESEHEQKKTLSRRATDGAAKNIRSDTCLFIDHNFNQKIFENIMLGLRKTLEIYFDETSFLNFLRLNDAHLLPIKIQKTAPGEGFHDWHVEKFYKDFCSRILVYTIYLNDIEEGGETEFLLQHQRVKAKQGRICIFPSTFPYLHRGNPPLKDCKYIITSWLRA